jgi:hypothetical protein
MKNSYRLRINIKQLEAHEGSKEIVGKKNIEPSAQL